MYPGPNEKPNAVILGLHCVLQMHRKWYEGYLKSNLNRTAGEGLVGTIAHAVWWEPAGPLLNGRPESNAGAVWRVCIIVSAARSAWLQTICNSAARVNRARPGQVQQMRAAPGSIEYWLVCTALAAALLVSMSQHK